MDFWVELFLFVIFPIVGFGVVIFFIVHWLVKKAIKDGTWQDEADQNDSE